MDLHLHEMYQSPEPSQCQSAVKQKMELQVQAPQKQVVFCIVCIVDTLLHVGQNTGTNCLAVISENKRNMLRRKDIQQSNKQDMNKQSARYESCYV